jgi:hypothetical protein
MLWYCGYQAFPRVSASDLAHCFLRGHDAGSNRPKDLRGWYAFPSGVAGFVLAEAATPVELAKILEPYSRLVEWKIEAVAELNYNQVLEELRRSTHRLAVDDLAAGVAPAKMAARAQRR